MLAALRGIYPYDPVKPTVSNKFCELFVDEVGGLKVNAISLNFGWDEALRKFKENYSFLNTRMVDATVKGIEEGFNAAVNALLITDPKLAAETIELRQKYVEDEAKRGRKERA